VELVGKHTDSRDLVLVPEAVWRNTCPKLPLREIYLTPILFLTCEHVMETDLLN